MGCLYQDLLPCCKAKRRLGKSIQEEGKDWSKGKEHYEILSLGHDEDSASLLTHYNKLTEGHLPELLEAFQEE